MAAVFRQSQRLAAHQPGELICQFFALQQREFHRNREAAVKAARHDALDTPDLIEICDDLLADFARGLGTERDSARRDVDRRAFEFLAFLAHELSLQAELEPLMA